MLEHCSHVRLEAKRRALDAISMHRRETPNPEAAAGGNHVIKHVINGVDLTGLEPQLMEKAGGDDGARTRDFMRDRYETTAFAGLPAASAGETDGQMMCPMQ